jgi:hypothetical protein
MPMWCNVLLKRCKYDVTSFVVNLVQSTNYYGFAAFSVKLLPN